MKIIPMIVIMVLAATNIGANSVITRQRAAMEELSAADKALKAADAELEAKAIALESGMTELQTADDRLQKSAAAAVASIADDNNRLIAATQKYKDTCERVLVAKAASFQ